MNFRLQYTYLTKYLRDTDNALHAIIIGEQETFVLIFISYRFKAS